MTAAKRHLDTWILHSVIYWHLGHTATVKAWGRKGNSPTPEQRSWNNSLSLFFFLTPFKILNFINQNLTALGPERALLLTISQSRTSPFQSNLQGLICDRDDTWPRPWGQPRLTGWAQRQRSPRSPRFRRSGLGSI